MALTINNITINVGDYPRKTDLDIVHAMVSGTIFGNEK